MAYSSGVVATDISKLAPQVGLYSGTSKPTAVQIETELVPDVEREVEAVLTGLGYRVDDIASWSAAATARVKEIVKWGVLKLALMARGLTVGNPDDQGITWATREYERRLKALYDPKSPDKLVGATYTGAGLEKDGADLMASFTVGGGVDDTQERRLTRDQVF